jgi:hypothetical protein
LFEYVGVNLWGNTLFVENHFLENHFAEKHKANKKINHGSLLSGITLMVLPMSPKACGGQKCYGDERTD